MEKQATQSFLTGREASTLKASTELMLFHLKYWQCS